MTCTRKNHTAELDQHLCSSIRTITDLARMLEAVRYTSGLGKQQWERVERARKVAAEAEQFLASISQADAS